MRSIAIVLVVSCLVALAVATESESGPHGGPCVLGLCTAPDECCTSALLFGKCVKKGKEGEKCPCVYNIGCGKDLKCVKGKCEKKEAKEANFNRESLSA